MDLAVLAILAAARKVQYRRYDMTATRLSERRMNATLRRHDGLAIDLEVDDHQITSPSEYAGVSTKRGFSRWASDTLCPDLAESMLLLRRTIFIGGGRRDLDRRPTAADGARNLGACFVMQAERAPYALRMRGSTIEFVDGATPLRSDRTA